MQIKDVQIFGERCSGTNFIHALIERNFDVTVTSDYGFKHWFIPGVHPRGKPNRTTDLESRKNLKDSNNTLFLFVFRNPYSWLQSLYLKPHHSEGSKFSDFHSFLRTEWTSGDKIRQHEKWEKNHNDKFFWIESEKNILSLRNLKNAHFFSVMKAVQHSLKIKYEAIATDQSEILELAQMYRLKRRAKKLVEIQNYKGKAGELFKQPNYPRISLRDFKYINHELNWNLEKEIGYPKASLFDWMFRGKL